MLWGTPVIPALKEAEKEDGKFEASLGYIESPVSKEKEKEKQHNLLLIHGEIFKTTCICVN
jgi:hypothetical protein